MFSLKSKIAYSLYNKNSSSLKKLILNSNESIKLIATLNQNSTNESISLESLKEKFRVLNKPKYYEVLVKKNPNISKLKRASVLVPISIRQELNEATGQMVNKTYFTLSKRTEHMNSFKGQVCFLGGKQDASDADEVAAAFRESKEEANIDSNTNLTFLAQLCPLITFNTVFVTPVICYFDKTNYQPILNKNEVDMLFDIPTERFLSNHNHKTKNIKNESGEYIIHYFKDKIVDYSKNNKEVVTWGFTAFLASCISVLIHSRNAEFELVPEQHLRQMKIENVNEFFEEYLFEKMAVSEKFFEKKT